MSDLFWLSDAQQARLEPCFPKRHGKPRVDDRRVLSGIIFINRNGLRWRDAPAEYGPHKTLYNRWKRWSEKGVFARIMAGLAAEHREEKTVMIDATYLTHSFPACQIGRGVASNLKPRHAPIAGVATPQMRRDELEPALRPVARGIEKHQFGDAVSVLSQIPQPRLGGDVHDGHQPDDMLAERHRMAGETADLRPRRIRHDPVDRIAPREEIPTQRQFAPGVFDLIGKLVVKRARAPGRI